MLRKEAIKIIIENDITKLTREEREALILNSWGIDEHDPEFHYFSTSLQYELLSSDIPTNDVMDLRYNDLLLIGAEGSFYGIPNNYLSKLVSEIVGSHIKVEGYVEKLLPCPCCNYETLIQRGEYEICPVCFWEDDGNNVPSRYSGPNHMTLSEGRRNFEKYGACSKEEVKSIASNRYEIYNKAE
ncbi:CPCC family cysteine-rich protein [Rummeliibacillus stabekisii]|uniref:CPCC family cysteine-rich protein n=1 Tax=Rummeliibacillus stabekisii TaxID=241244 RepID=UPI0037217116